MLGRHPSHDRAAIDAACARIAPAWPLDRLIAVNPYWGWVDRPISAAAAELGALAGIRLTMPRPWYRDRFDEGDLAVDDIARALALTGARLTVAEVVAALRATPTPPTAHPLVTDVRDAIAPLTPEAPWRDLVVQSIGRACEAWFDGTQAAWQPDRTAGLYATWRAQARVDAAPRIMRGLRGFAEAVDELPATREALFEDALDTLAVAPPGRESYLTALLLSVNGWASSCAFDRWEARLAGGTDHTLEELLAIRLAWELLLFRTAAGSPLAGHWRLARKAWQERAAHVAADQTIDWVLQRAVESRYQERLARALSSVPTAVPLRFGPSAPMTTTAQAVFCIDVRSEVLRRHLETAMPGVRTLGFAGFFGLPLAYAAVDGASRPQLPGLLRPSVVATDVGADVETARANAVRAALDGTAADALARGTPAAFSFVESTGLAALAGLLRGDLARAPRPGDARRAGLDAPGALAAPTLTHRADGTALTSTERVELAAAALRGMSLVEGFARLVVFVGHGATVTNNPQAAGLACGACGGQSGEVNARALAALLEADDVRAGLAARGIVIPDTTRFIGGLHDTVTDTVTLYAPPAVRRTHAEDVAALQRAFDAAGDRTRRERAAALGVPAAPVPALASLMRERAADWAELRPEWALARNAVFIAAPRERTRPLDLHGRAFLHEYRWQADRGFEVLESILTAPVVVAHWINLQYYASTVDPDHAGSGDKTLHNVVAGGRGVYEGAGGDLRVGLALQSVHDGARFVHDPLRLAVFVEAPATAIDNVLARHPVVHDLVRNEWIHLHRIDSADSRIELRRPDRWEPLPRPAHASAKAALHAVAPE